MMKKKAICFILAVFMLATLTACEWNERGEAEGRSAQDGRITCIYNDGLAIIYQDNETGVQYLSRANAGTCVMVGSDGAPYTGE